MNVILFVLAALAIAGTQALMGGWHPALSLPGYALLGCAGLLSWWKTRRTPLPAGAGEGLAACALLFGYIVIRAIFSPEEYLARNDLFVALAAMTLYLLVALNLNSSQWRGRFVGFLMLLGVVNCVIGAIQFLKGGNFGIFGFLPRPDYGSRASGLFGYPNHLALFLEVCVMMGFSAALWSRWRPSLKILAGYSGLICIGGLLLTGSRGGFAGGIAGLIAFGILSLRLVGSLARTRGIALLAAGLLLFAGLGLGVQHAVTQSTFLQSRIGQVVTNTDIRLQLWKAAWREFRLQPVTGTGSGTYLYYGRQFSNTLVTSDPVHAHNEYLELLAEYGILGITAALIFLDFHLRSGWRWISRHITEQQDMLASGGNSLAFTVGAMSSVVALMVHSGTDFTLHIPANMLVFAAIFGLLCNPGGVRPGHVASSRSSQKDDSSLPSGLRLALPALGLWLAMRALPTWPAESLDFQARAITADWQYMASGEVARGLEDLAHRGLRWDPRHPQLHRYAGVAETSLAVQSTDPAVRKGWSDKAISSYENALKLAPRDVYFVLNLAWAYEAQERFVDAEPLFKRAVELYPTSSNARYAYASHLRGQGRLDEAAGEYQVAVNLSSDPSSQMALDQMALDRMAEEKKARSQGESNPAPVAPDR